MFSSSSSSASSSFTSTTEWDAEKLCQLSQFLLFQQNGTNKEELISPPVDGSVPLQAKLFGANFSATNSDGEQPEKEEAQEHHNQQQQTQKCTICRIEKAKVSHFGVSICTGCRAFFRRSVAKQKAYMCLKSRLCGGTNPVPNRRVCKFCRFQRCVEAGMLRSKGQFQLQQLEHQQQQMLVAKLRLDAHPSVHPPNAFESANASNVLAQFLVCRRKIAYERMHHFYGDQRRLNGEQSVMHCPPSMKHAVELGWKESVLFHRHIFNALAPFSNVQQLDRVPLFLDYAFSWTMAESLWATIRNGGHHCRRSYHLDGRFIQINEQGAQNFFGPTLNEVLKDSSPSVQQAVLDFFTACSMASHRMARHIAQAGLAEEEAIGLTLLLFTRQEVLRMVSDECANTLLQLRQRTLRSLAEHIGSVGYNVPERMGQIILLLTPMQQMLRLNKSMSPLLRSACVEGSLLPDDYLKLVDEAQTNLERLRIS